MSPSTSWNAAFVSICICAAAFLASVIATTTGWHAVATGRAAGGFAVALVASGVWLHRAAFRVERAEPEGDDEPDGGAQ